MLRQKRHKAEPAAVSGAAYGFGITLSAPSADLLTRMQGALPPAWADGAAASVTLDFKLGGYGTDEYGVSVDGAVMAHGDLDGVLRVLPRMIRQYVASNAPDVVFVHAGAVAYQGHGIIIPGSSFAGKTTLVAALIRAGAAYYSDEYAVLAPNGQLIPYHADPMIRLTEGSRRQTRVPLKEMGDVALGTVPVPIGLVVLTEYRPGTTWSPVEFSRAEGVVGTLAHAEPVQERPRQAVEIVTRALGAATVLYGSRGDADAAAAALLALPARPSV